jgi:DNA polymerase
MADNSPQHMMRRYLTQLLEQGERELPFRLPAMRPRASAAPASLPGAAAVKPAMMARQPVVLQRPSIPAAFGATTVDLETFRAEICHCQKCALGKRRKNFVFGDGDASARIVFVGEAPGEEEDNQGRPFVGAAGQLLTKIIEAIKFRRSEVYICNILKCRPPENRDPERDEIVACTPYLRRQLEIIEPRVICCLGRHAAQTLLGTSAALAALRERAHFFDGVPVVVTFHPAALLRNPHWKRPTWDDVRKLRALYDALRAPA